MQKKWCGHGRTGRTASLAPDLCFPLITLGQKNPWLTSCPKNKRLLEKCPARIALTTGLCADSSDGHLVCRQDIF